MAQRTNRNERKAPHIPQAPPNTPSHVVLILDGNGRWATRRGLPRLEGHRHTTRNFIRLADAALDLKIPVLTLYVFSTENWRRHPDEVGGLLGLLAEEIAPLAAQAHARGVCVRHLGSLAGLPEALRRTIAEAVALTRDNRRMIINLAVNYGGRTEITDAVRRLITARVPAEQINEHTIAAALDTAGQPDADLVIRTGGELRLSNCPLWQVAYSELYFSPKLGPDFTDDDLREAVTAFRSRQRTYGRGPGTAWPP